MTRFLSLLLIAFAAICATSCGDPLDIFDDLGTEDSDDSATTTAYTGETSISSDDGETFSNDSALITINDVVYSVTLTMYDIQFADNTPAIDIVLSGIKSSSTSGKYTEDLVVPTNTSGVLFTNTTITNVVILIDEDSIDITFDCTYDDETYDITYSGEVKS